MEQEFKRPEIWIKIKIDRSDINARSLSFIRMKKKKKENFVKFIELQGRRISIVCACNKQRTEEKNEFISASAIIVAAQTKDTKEDNIFISNKKH